MKVVEKKVVVEVTKPIPDNLLIPCAPDPQVEKPAKVEALLDQSILRQSRLIECSDYMNALIKYNDKIKASAAQTPTPNPPE